MQKVNLPESLQNKISLFEKEFDLIPQERKSKLLQLSQYISARIKSQQTAKVIVICTHNSRRSHIGQLWLKIAALHLGIEGFESYSGGTEATAFNHRSVAALRKAGFPLNQITEGSNPIYKLNLTGDANTSMDLFSKKYDTPPNPNSGFAAVMVCAEADAGCPFVPGAEARFAIPYEDPKEFDDSPLESQAYEKRVHQIGREMCYVVGLASKHSNA